MLLKSRTLCHVHPCSIEELRMSTQSMSSERPARSANWYTNLALTVIAGLLALHLLKNSGMPIEASANAQVGIVGNTAPAADTNEGLVSAAEQRKQIVAELHKLDGRLERIESALAKGINVKVTSMPATKADSKSDSK